MVGNDLGILLSRLRVLLDKMEQRPNVVRNIVFTCVMLYNMLRTHQGRTDRAPSPANDIAALQNENFVYVPDDNYRNRSREARYQQDLLKDNFNHLGASVGQKDSI